MSVPRTNRPLLGKRIVVTGAEGDSDDLRARLQGCGGCVVELPVIAIEPPDNWDPVDQALSHVEAYSWIAFASRNAVRSVLVRLGALNQSIGSLRSARIAAVGESTAALLRQAGLQIDCLPAMASGAALAEAMAALGVTGRRVLLPCGNISRPELPAHLRTAGALVDQVVVYKTVLPAGVDAETLELLRTGSVDLITLASPSAIHNLVAVLGRPASLQGHHLAAMGPTTAQAVSEYGLQTAVVAEPSSVDGLVAAIVRYFESENLS